MEANQHTGNKETTRGLLSQQEMEMIEEMER
jgi:hypothetical protein